MGRKVKWKEEGRGKKRRNGSSLCDVLLNMDVAMKRQGNDNEDRQPDKRPRLHQVLHTLLRSY